MSVAGTEAGGGFTPTAPELLVVRLILGVGAARTADLSAGVCVCAWVCAWDSHSSAARSSSASNAANMPLMAENPDMPASESRFLLLLLLVVV